MSCFWKNTPLTRKALYQYLGAGGRDAVWTCSLVAAFACVHASCFRATSTRVTCDCTDADILVSLLIATAAAVSVCTDVEQSTLAKTTRNLTRTGTTRQNVNRIQNRCPPLTSSIRTIQNAAGVHTSCLKRGHVAEVHFSNSAMAWGSAPDAYA